MAEIVKWESPENRPGPLGKDVHVWLADMSTGSHRIDFFAALLSPDETARAERFVFEKDRKKYTIARGILRLLLADYTRMVPREILIGQKEKGKPFLMSSCDYPLKFNLSHAGDYAIYGFSENRELGIDIEQFKPMLDREQIVSRFFSKEEVEAYFRLPEKDRVRAFFSCWTRKEAFIKAIGDGLHYSLDSFSVPVEPDVLSDMEILVGGLKEEKWSMHDIPLAHDHYVSSIAIEGKGYQIKCRPWGISARIS